MKICVSGWYFTDPEGRVPKEEYEAFYHLMTLVHKKYPVHIVSHFRHEFVERVGVPYTVIPIIGLEWACYDYYLKNLWDGDSNVFFVHDDERVAGPEVFDEIAKLSGMRVDQAYVFEDEAESAANGRQHGRGVWCSKRYLHFLRSYRCECRESKDHFNSHNPDVLLPGTGPHWGIWFDPYNRGDHTQGKVPRGCRHYNAGIYHFAGIAGIAHKFGLVTKHQHYVPGFVSGRRAKYGCYEKTREKLKKEAEDAESRDGGADKIGGDAVDTPEAEVRRDMAGGEAPEDSGRPRQEG